MSTARAAGRDTSAGLALLGAALTSVAAVGVVAVAVSALASPAAALGAGLGALLAAVAFSVPALLLMWTARWSPPAVMAVALIAYLIVVMLLGLAYAVLQGTSWLSADHLGWTLMVAAAVAVARQMRAVARLRILAFGSTSDT